MGKALFTLILLTALGLGGAVTAAPANLDGDWVGKLQATPLIALRLTLHIHQTTHGLFEGTLDSVDQGALGLKLAALSRDGATVSFEVPVVHGAFTGSLDPETKILTGTWSQGPGKLPLTFTRLDPGIAPPGLNRPQTPQPPFPYASRDVVIENAAAKVRLAGTLTTPPGPGLFPAVVLIAGSGPNTRDEPVFGHRPFLILADYLTRRGIAALRYDKRGVGGSTGEYGAATTLDFADDAEAAAAWLAAQPGVDPRRIGLIGHSEGGLVAPLAASRDHEIAFIVLLAGPGVDGGRILSAQGRLISRAMGVSEAEIDRSAGLRDRMIDIIRTEPDRAEAAIKLKAAADAYGEAHHLDPQVLATLKTQYETINGDWFRTFLTYDPAPALRSLRIPVLALIGERDLQVPADLNIPALRAAMADDPKAQVEELPGLNHLFQPAKTGGVSEYAEIETTMAPEVLDRLARWVLTSTQP
jgi:pimeloyl-ACP methyl ester carboxylesterase